MDVLVGAGHKDVGEESQAYVALPFSEGRGEGVAIEGRGEAMAGSKNVPNPLPAEAGGHDLGDDCAAVGVIELGLLFEAPDGFAVGGIRGHQCTV